MVIALLASRKLSDIDMSAMLDKMIWSATYHLKRANGHGDRYLRHFKAGEYDYADADNANMIRERSAMTASIWGLSQVIRERTIRERADAESLVYRGAVEWRQPACAGDTCDICEYPLSWHLLLEGDCEVCPVDRSFWVLAHALNRDPSGIPADRYWPFLRIIARGTRRTLASVSRR